MYLQIFDGRASEDQVNHWRYGRRHMPMWARELLADKLERKYRGNTPIDTARRIREAPTHPGQAIGRINLAKWKVEQAKKKAGP